jgi:hypothetical protein
LTTSSLTGRETEDVLGLSDCRANHKKKIKKMIRKRPMKKQMIMKKTTTMIRINKEK